MACVTLALAEARCPCGTILSRYRDPGETLCAACQKKQKEAEPATRVLGAEELVDAVAGLLLVGRALCPGGRVYLRRRLRKLGVEADHVDIHQAVQKLRRRYGWEIEAETREAGHRLTAWPYRFRRDRGPQLRLFRGR